jgi:hypothetical protein
MESGTTRTTPLRDSSILRKLAELKERQGWVHHVADAATGKLLTTRLRRPVAPLSRAARLSRLGHQFDPSTFGTPTYRLTPRYPYQGSPLGFLKFHWARYVNTLGYGDPEQEGFAFWRVAEDIVGEKVGGMDAVVFEPPQGRCLLTLWLGTHNEPGQVGRIRIEVVGYPGGGEATVIASFQIAAHGNDWLFNTFDLVFIPVSAPIPSQHSVRMVLESGSGLEMVEFLSLTLAPQRPLDIGP